MSLSLFQQFMNLDCDTSWIRLNKVDPSTETDPYFCDPIDSHTFAELGVDGIHFCLIESFGEMVFMVNPMPSDDRYVFPVASSFEDFLRLILTCKTANSLDQIVWMGRRQYENLQLETIRNLPKESYDILNTLEKEFHLSPISDPFRYIKKLVQEFDDSVLRFSDEYYDTLGLDNPNQ